MNNPRHVASLTQQDSIRFPNARHGIPRFTDAAFITLRNSLVLSTYNVIQLGTIQHRPWLVHFQKIRRAVARDDLTKVIRTKANATQVSRTCDNGHQVMLRKPFRLSSAKNEIIIVTCDNADLHTSKLAEWTPREQGPPLAQSGAFAGGKRKRWLHLLFQLHGSANVAAS